MASVLFLPQLVYLSDKALSRTLPPVLHSHPFTSIYNHEVCSYKQRSCVQPVPPSVLASLGKSLWFLSTSSSSYLLLTSWPIPPSLLAWNIATSYLVSFLCLPSYMVSSQKPKSLATSFKECDRAHTAASQPPYMIHSLLLPVRPFSHTLLCSLCSSDIPHYPLTVPRRISPPGLCTCYLSV